MKEEIDLIYALIKHPAAFDFGINGLLTIRRYEYPTWVVEEFDCGLGAPISFKEFDNPLEAAKFFVEKRHEYQLGLDFEINNKE